PSTAPDPRRRARPRNRPQMRGPNPTGERPPPPGRGARRGAGGTRGRRISACVARGKTSVLTGIRVVVGSADGRKCFCSTGFSSCLRGGGPPTSARYAGRRREARNAANPRLDPEGLHTEPSQYPGRPGFGAGPRCRRAPRRGSAINLEPDPIAFDPRAGGREIDARRAVAV